MPLTLKRSNKEPTRGLVLRRQPAGADLDARVFSFLEGRGTTGVTARELAKRLKGVSWELAGQSLLRLYGRGLLSHTWAPCADHKTHYALQEGCYAVRQTDQPPPWWAST